MALKVTNNAQSQLASGITAAAVSLTLKAGDGALFPTLGAGDWFPLTLFNSAGNVEVVQVTARASDTLTIVRAQDGTTARAWNANDFVQLRFTMGAFNELIKRDGSVAMTADLNRDGAATAYRAFGYTTTGGGVRWNHGATGQAETGSNAGSNWVLQRFSDAGVAIDTPLFVTRATGQLSTSVRPVFAGNTPYDSGNLPGTSITWTATQYFTNGGLNGSDVNPSLSAASGKYRYIQYLTNNVVRWVHGVDNVAESGANAGSNWFINRYDDTGAYLGLGFAISRASGTITFGGTLNVSGNRIANGADPINAQDFATKNYTDQVMRPNSMILNPHGSIFSENPSLTAITATGVAPYFTEQWRTESGGTSLAAQAGVGAAGINGAPQVSLYNPYHLYMRTTTAKAALAAGDYAFMHQPVEANFSTARMMYGTTAARYSWLVFRAAATQAATMSVSVRNNGGTRSFVSPVALTTAPTNYAIGIPGDTTGSWGLTTTALGAVVGFCLAAGTTYQTGTLNAWQAGNFLAANTQSNMLDTLNRGIYVSDVGWYDMVLQPSFTPVDLALEYLKCQRYFYKTYDENTAPATATTAGTVMKLSQTGANIYDTFSFPVAMRAAPAITFYSPVNGATATWNDGSNNPKSMSIQYIGTRHFGFVCTTATSGGLLYGHIVANARM